MREFLRKLHFFFFALFHFFPFSIFLHCILTPWVLSAPLVLVHNADIRTSLSPSLLQVRLSLIHMCDVLLPPRSVSQRHWSGGWTRSKTISSSTPSRPAPQNTPGRVFRKSHEAIIKHMRQNRMHLFKQLLVVDGIA